MKEITCKKCRSRDLFLRGNGAAIGLYCADCGVWQKWVAKKDLPLVEHCLKAQKETETKVPTFLGIWKKINANGTLSEPLTPAEIDLIWQAANA